MRVLLVQSDSGSTTHAVACVLATARARGNANSDGCNTRVATTMPAAAAAANEVLGCLQTQAAKQKSSAKKQHGRLCREKDSAGSDG